MCLPVGVWVRVLSADVILASLFHLLLFSSFLYHGESFFYKSGKTEMCEYKKYSNLLYGISVKALREISMINSYRITNEQTWNCCNILCIHLTY